MRRGTRSRSWSWAGWCGWPRSSGHSASRTRRFACSPSRYRRWRPSAHSTVFVTAWAHGLWNGLAYTLFGFGEARGAMGALDPLRFDPERGWAGVALNAAAFLMLWRWWQRQERAALARDND